ncbi:MAG: DUF2608 domain-containing protein [Pirellulales bacterium]
MSKILLTCARRATMVRCVAAMIVLSVGPAAAPASQISDTDDFADVATATMDYADKVGPERVLVVLDIDNTLLAMNQPLGSDQWFEWQRYLQEQEPRSRDLVAESFEGLLEAQGLLYNLGRMHPPQKNLPALISRLQGRGVRTLVLTSRGDEFRVAAERELNRNGYDFSKSALPVGDVPGGQYLPYDLDEPEADGLTRQEITAFRLTDPRPISYANGIMMTAGQAKGAMLLTILHRATVDVDAIVYADDTMRHVGFVFAAIAGRGEEISAFHYTREDARVKKFQYGDKEDVSRRWRRLSHVLEEVFE